MDILKTHYEIAKEAPKPVDTDCYFEAERKRYLEMLNRDLPENDYQLFFEENPAFMPGSKEVMGAASSHWPIANALISQPILSNDVKIRKPDFMWLAKDSLCFCPVLIEIEKPSKEEFRNDVDISRAGFNQAMMQIKHWKAILNSPEGQKDFYERYSVPSKFRELKFAPQYVLVFGRRSEYEGDSWLTKIRAEEQTDDFRIMSFDRLASPDMNVIDCVTCKVSNGKYKVINIPPTFVYKPATISAIEGYGMYYGFCEAISRMKYVSNDRKDFLTKRYEYWKKQAQEINNGLINTFDKE